MDTETTKCGYACNYVVDELDINKFAGDCNPATKLLVAGEPLTAKTATLLQEKSHDHPTRYLSLAQ
jgi:hypothetical protein